MWLKTSQASPPQRGSPSVSSYPNSHLNFHLNITFIMSSSKPSVLFVCLGNICRSTMGEGVLRSLVKKPEYKDVLDEIDSCGTGAYHIGESPHSVTMSVLEDHGTTDYKHAARKVSASQARISRHKRAHAPLDRHQRLRQLRLHLRHGSSKLPRHPRPEETQEERARQG